ncbi:MAG: glycoside hydrolase 43 family protein [Fusicatenibacter sp.]
MKLYEATNPVIPMDYPDPDVIRVGDTYYMISTTMYFMPGGEILRSYDLLHWEVAGYVYEELDGTPAQRLEGEETIYGKGMWAASLRFHQGMFYVCFVANDTHQTYLYCSKQVEGPWTKQIIKGFYHDCSLLFDEDERVYLVYGNHSIYLTELEPDLSGPKKGGLHRLLVKDESNVRLGYEGSHIYKINGNYYLFLIHWPAEEQGRRTQACFVSESLEGEFVGGDVTDDSMGYRNAGVAQGGIVDTPDGKWYAMLFQDRGACGRMPVLVPIKFRDGFPIFGEQGRIPKRIEMKSSRPEYTYEPLYTDDDFKYDPKADGSVCLKSAWQWNHTPDQRLWSVTDQPGTLRVCIGKVSRDLTFAQNTLTQRTCQPWCAASVTVDAEELNNGDRAGICALQSCYGMIAITKEQDSCYLVMEAKNQPEECGREYARIPYPGEKVRLKVFCRFTDEKDEAVFYYEQKGEWIPLGCVHPLRYTLDHFTGCRFGLFAYAANVPGGTAEFSDFRYEK